MNDASDGALWKLPVPSHKVTAPDWMASMPIALVEKPVVVV